MKRLLTLRLFLYVILHIQAETFQQQIVEKPEVEVKLRIPSFLVSEKIEN